MLITNKGDITTDFVVSKLTSLRVAFYRLNTEEIGKSVQVSLTVNNGHFYLYDISKGIAINLCEVKSVYFRRPEIHVTNNTLTSGQKEFIKAELLYTLEGIYRILGNAFWISNVYDIRNAENKLFQLILAKELGFEIPNSIISNHPKQVEAFYSENNSLCIIKPIKSGLVGTNNEEGVIFTSKVEINKQNLERTRECPIYLQNLIEKQADIRVTIVGTKLFPAFIHSQANEEARVDWRKTDEILEYSQISLPLDLVKRCQALTKKLNLNFAAIDFVLDQLGNYIFLEINPNGQWAWIEKQLNFKISDEIASLLVEKIS
ncbi:hypothetical protein QWY89_03350 [Mucilaginibacter myungsuensis]|uniref:MvdC/MvdD family ATP grasp protein n=1 Tax=Mucilaginibacter myungsuensis TaxID=649104 RepID=UPI0025B3D7C3|nr:hypothetical protein [Mucilaginibacter myungsuensis]MDN3597666.1 hypothetical protein [Mucilaginibacter myungsuensis]